MEPDQAIERILEAKGMLTGGISFFEVAILLLGFYILTVDLSPKINYDLGDK